MQIYDPIGVYKAKKEDAKKLKVDLGIILPSEFDSEEKKYRVMILDAIDISNGGHNGMFLAIRIENKEKQEVGDLSNGKYPVVNEVKFDLPIEEFEASVEKSHVIIFHSNNFTLKGNEAVVQNARDFVKNHGYNTDVVFGRSETQKEIIYQPETAGGGILVGTGG
ncbi:hypothetical protein MKO06_03885 [Gramella sp. GC03-9]|uniref:Uncharacterized protein n=1 Tax=Christiangramia oceanisediminis TaxID=2920386 RepID=A0A9X2KW83_9FLAO|nr:hypothetical protein [Gramella oceanisediminis]MCP9199034.1 hypothetical protein [Gramella oceanisediminis]